MTDPLAAIMQNAAADLDELLRMTAVDLDAILRDVALPEPLPSDPVGLLPVWKAPPAL